MFQLTTTKLLHSLFGIGPESSFEVGNLTPHPQSSAGQCWPLSLPLFKMETVSCLSLFFLVQRFLPSFLPAVSGFLPMWMWWLTFPRCEMQVWEVGSFPCLSRGFSESMVLLSFLINASLLIQMVFLLATVVLGLLQYLISHVLECLLYTCLKLGRPWELLEDHTKILNLVRWHRQIPPPPAHFRAYLVKLLCLTISSSFNRGVLGACSGNLLVGAQLRSW